MQLLETPPGQRPPPARRRPHHLGQPARSSTTATSSSNGRKTDIASYLVKPGQTITFKEGIHKVLRENMEQNAGHHVPNWLEWNPAQLTATIKAMPVLEDVPFEVNLNLIIEFYR